MSKYTIELRFAIESMANLDESVGLHDVDKTIETARPALFNFTFPIFDENYRIPLEHKIMRHFYLREIGFETIGLFQFMLGNKLNEIMPYYNQLYQSELIKFDPLQDYWKKEISNREGVGDNSGTLTDVTRKTGNENTVGNADDARKIAEIIGDTHSGTTSGTDNTEFETTRDTTGNDNTTAETTRDNTEKFIGSKNDTAHGEITDNRVDQKTDTYNGTKWTYNHNTPQSHIDTLGDLDYLSSATKETDTNTLNSRGSKDRDVITNDSSETTDNQDTTKKETGNDTVNKTTTGKETGNDTTNKTTSGKDDWTTDRDRSVDDTLKHTDSKNVDKTEQGNLDRNTTGRYNTTEDYIATISGKVGGYTYSKMLMEFRQTFLNIDAMILRDLESLFFGLW